MQFYPAMKKDRYIAIRNQAADDILEIFFLDVIADTYDWYEGSSSPVQTLIDKVNYYKPSRIKVTIDSEGGDAQKGIAIYNFLKRCDAKIEVEIIGLAASIASVIAMAANKGKLRIARNAFIMIHKAEGACWGTSEEMRIYADLVDKYTGQIVDIYSQRTGKSVEEINTLIENGDYWMTGEEAVSMGFADETFNDTPNLQIAARLDPALYKNIPEKIRAQMKPKNGEGNDEPNFFTKQKEEMKKFFSDLATEIKNAFKGQKPEGNEHITNLGDTVSAVFANAAEKIDASVEEAVTNGLKKPEVINQVSEEVKKAIKPESVDFTQEGPKNALGEAVKNAISGMSFTEDGPLKKAFDEAVTNSVDAAVKAKTEELQKEITALKGNRSTTGSTENPSMPIGGFN